MTQVLLTRSAAQNNLLASKIASENALIVSMPLLRTEALPLDHASKALLLSLDQFDDIIFISQNAVHFGLEKLGSYWPQWPLNLRWFAVGKATARALEKEGVTSIFPKQASSEDLLALPELEHVSDRACLIVRGFGGRETLKEGLQSRGARVSYLEVYQRLEIEYAAVDFPDGEHVVSLVYSGEALAHLFRSVGTRALSYHVIVPSSRLQTVAIDMGFDQVELANSQEDDAMLEVLNNLLGQ